MSALEDLIARFQRDLYKPEREHLRRAELEAMTLYNRIAHELAEEIRAELPETVKEKLGGGIWEIRTIPTARQAADLIDPEVP